MSPSASKPRLLRFGIAWRLSLAFIGVAALSVVACFVGWLSYARLAENIDSINRVHLPAASLTAKLAEQGGAVTAAAPVLALARGAKEYANAKQGLDERLGVMRKVLAQATSEGVADPAGAGRLSADVEAIAQNLEALDEVVRRRLELEKSNRELIAQLRWLQADVMEEVEPLLEDRRFVVRSILARLAGDPPRSAGDVPLLASEFKRMEALSGLSAQANLAVGLMNRVATLSTLEELSQTMQFLAETADAIEPHLLALADAADAVTLRQALRKLLEMSSLEWGLPGLRRAEILASEEARALLARNGTLVQELGQAIDAYVNAASAQAAAAALSSASAINIGRNLLAGLAAFSMFTAFGVGVFYVKRNLVSRIQSLSDAARALEAGDLATPIDRRGQDELSDMAHALARFRDTKEELVQAAKLAALGQLAAGIGHELNQPLAAIRSQAHNSRLLISRDRLADADAALARIESLTIRMGDCVAHLKRFARKPLGQRGPVSLATAIQESIALFGTRLDDEGVTLTIDEAHDVHVMGEDVRLEQIFVNLISNALDAMKDLPDKQLSICIERGEELVVVIVRDSGAGVPAAEASTIFDPFVTTKPIGAGLGLGLSISYNIAKDFGGSLALSSTNEVGGAFVLSLKRANV